MCLALFKSQPYNQKTAFKILIREGNRYYTGMCAGKKIRLFKTKWAKADSNWIRSPHKGGTYYEGGFHCLVDLKSARIVMKDFQKNQSGQWEQYCICKVEIREEVNHGVVHWTLPTAFYNAHDGFPFKTVTVVARQCKILEVIE